MHQKFAAFVFAALCWAQVSAQSTAFVFKGGLSLGTQKWDNSFDRQVLFKSHAALAIESVNNEDDRSSVFAQFGYHTRGSAIRSRFLFNGGGVSTFTQEFTFSNFSLILGAKQKFDLGPKAKYYYYGGLRGDYTLKTNIDELQPPGGVEPAFATYFYLSNPVIGGVQRWMAGLSVGGGMEFMFSELIGGQLELSVHPDLTSQYRTPPLTTSVQDPFTGGFVSIPERRIKNTTIELSLGLRLLRKVVYED